MNLEFLPNELLFDIFEYLSTVNLFQSFFNLNIRFNNIIIFYFKTHFFNFQSISKYNFDLICQKYFPLIKNEILFLHLSDDDDTPKQIDLFFSYGLSFHQFSHLQSLSIYRLYSLNLFQKIIDQLIYLPHLIYLKIIRYTIIFNDIYDIGIINIIQYLSKLIYCHLDITNDNDSYFLIPPIISSSLKYLSISQLDCNINQLIYLIKNVPNLEILNTRIIDYSTNLQISSSSVNKFLSIKKLKIIFYGSLNTLNNLLKMMINLKELKIDIQSIYINGYQWKNIIENNLPYLIILQFKMSISYVKYNEENFNEIINSFHSQFWIEKHQWFIQCDYIQNNNNQTIYVYTLPYAFQDFLYKGNIRLGSTCSNQNYSFDRIRNLYYNCIQNQNSSLFYIFLRNIRYLDLTIPFDNSFWSIITRFDRLKSLCIVLYKDINYHNIQLNLQILLNQLTNLYSLKIFSWYNKNIFPFKLNNTSIRYLDLCGPNLFYNQQQCIELSHSLIGQQCKTLLINIQQQTDIFYLINNMNNLHALIFKCSKQDEKLIQWLQQYLPSTCAISYSIEINDYIRLWIR